MFSILLTDRVMDVTTVVLFVAAIQVLATGMIADIIDRPAGLTRPEPQGPGWRGLRFIYRNWERFRGRVFFYHPERHLLRRGRHPIAPWEASSLWRKSATTYKSPPPPAEVSGPPLPWSFMLRPNLHGMK